MFGGHSWNWLKSSDDEQEKQQRRLQQQLNQQQQQQRRNQEEQEQEQLDRWQQIDVWNDETEKSTVAQSQISSSVALSRWGPGF